MCDRDGRPVAVEVFEGNTADPATIAMQVEKLRKRFKLNRVVLVGDRGMITSARIRDRPSKRPNALDWTRALRSEKNRKLVHVRPTLAVRRTRPGRVIDPTFPATRLVALTAHQQLATGTMAIQAILLAATDEAAQPEYTLPPGTRKLVHKPGTGRIARRVERYANKYKTRRSTLNSRAAVNSSATCVRKKTTRQRSSTRRHLCHPNQSPRRRCSPHTKWDCRSL